MYMFVFTYMLIRSTMADVQEQSNNKKCILVAADGSENSEYALAWCIDQVYRPGDYVVVAHIPEYKGIVVTPTMTADAGLITKMVEDEQNRSRAIETKFAQVLKDAGVEGKVKQFNGEPGEKILEAAKLEGASMIVTGSRGLGKWRRTFMGSVSDYIVHHSSIPVLVVRHK